jgi:hypothetical protein
LPGSRYGKIRWKLIVDDAALIEAAGSPGDSEAAQPSVTLAPRLDGL